MKTKWTKKELEWELNWHLHDLQKQARRYQHQRIQGIKKCDPIEARFFGEQRDICRDAAEILANILREKTHIPKNIVFLAKCWREGRSYP